MNGRSITARNLTGAFLGGMLGILSCAYIHPWAIPGGVAVGVIGGYWYDAIWQCLLASIQRAVLFTEDAVLAVGQALQTPAHAASKLYNHFGPKNPFSFLLGVFMATVTLVLGGIWWLLKSPFVFRRWAHKSVESQEAIYFIMGFVTYFAFLSFGMIQVMIHFTNPVQPHHIAAAYTESLIVRGVEPAGLLEYLVGALCGALVIAFAGSIPRLLVMDNMGGEKVMQRRMTHYTALKQSGILYTYYEAATWALWAAQTTAFLTATIVYTTLALACFMLLVTLPITCMLLFAHGVVCISLRRQHLLCLATTMFVTCVTAWKLQPFFTQASLIWTIALCNGFISAVITEAIRRTLVNFVLGQHGWKFVVAINPSSYIHWFDSVLERVLSFPAVIARGVFSVVL